MSKFELWYPIKPYKINQAWGIYNPAYLKFGFDQHNGIDIALIDSQEIRCPQDSIITRIGFQPDGAGNYVQMKTIDKYDFPDGITCNVLMDFFHNKEIKVKVGDIVKVGDLIALGDNTGFSTGYHSHMECRRIDDNNNTIDDNRANNSFNQELYWNKYFAQDTQLVIGILQKMIELLKLSLTMFKK